MARGNPNGNPNIREISKGTQYKKGDPRAIENGKKGASVQSMMRRTVKEIASDTLNAENQKLLDIIVKRTIKMAAEGNLPAIQYLIKLIGQEPSEKIEITQADYSALDTVKWDE